MSFNLGNVMLKVRKGIGQALFPNKCIFCNSFSERCHLDHGVCRKCFDRVIFLNNPNITHIFNNINNAPDEVYCACRYVDVIKKGIVSLKYSGKGYIGDSLAWLLYYALEKYLDFSKYDFICCVPSSEDKLRERGYNQAEIVAKGLSQFTGVLYRDNILLKTSDPTSQSLLNVSERLKSVSGIYQVLKKDSVYGKNIIIVDDVLTTGATILECSKILKCSGASKVTAAILTTGKRNI